MERRRRHALRPHVKESHLCPNRSARTKSIRAARQGSSSSLATLYVMLAFEIYINGKKRCTAGVRGPCVLTAALCWVLREHASRSRKRKELNLGVGGLVSRSDESLEWLQRDVQPGDEVTIRIIEAAKVDEPKKRRRHRATPAQIQARKQALVRRLTKELGWKVQAQ